MIKKYDRLEWGDEILEYTGFSPFVDSEEQCLFVGVNSQGEAKPRFFTEKELESSEFKKLPPLPTHPAVLEAARLTRDMPEIRAQFAKALSIQFKASTPAQKRDVIGLLRKALPKELRNALTCGSYADNAGNARKEYGGDSD